MKLALLRFAARHPITSLLLVTAIAVAGVSRAVAWLTPAEEGDGAVEPRTILNRVWLESMPERPRDEHKLLLFFGGGLGVYHAGSAFRFAVDVFDFERQGDRIVAAFLHDGQPATTRFQVSRCSERPPFDLCLDFDEAPRGPRRYYGFASGEELAEQIPWAPKLVEAARAATRVR